MTGQEKHVQAEECKDGCVEGRDRFFMDVDRMVNEGLGGGNVTIDNGLIEESTIDTMDHPDSVLDKD